MLRIRIRPSAGARGSAREGDPERAEVELTGEGPARLLDLLDDQTGAGVPLSCRAAHCGSCRVHVTRGAERFETATPAELETLDALGAGPGERLACQLWLAPGAHGEAELLVLNAAARP